MEYYSIIKRNEKPIHATTWMKLGNNMPSARSQITKDHILYYFYLYEISRIGKSTETESRLVVARGWGKKRSTCLKV